MRNVQVNLFAQPALGANAEAVAGQTGLRLTRHNRLAWVS